MDSLRSDSRRPEVLVADTAAVAPERPASDPELSSDVLDALAELDPDQRAVIVLRHLFGYRSREIGRMLGIRSATVRTRLRRGLAALRALYEDESLDRKGEGP